MREKPKEERENGHGICLLSVVSINCVCLQGSFVRNGY